MSNFSSIHFHTKRLYVSLHNLIQRYCLQLWKIIDHFRNFEDKRKYFACDLKCRYCVFTLRGRISIPLFAPSFVFEHSKDSALIAPLGSIPGINTLCVSEFGWLSIPGLADFQPKGCEFEPRYGQRIGNVLLFIACHLAFFPS